MKALSAIVGALALTSFGCGDDVTSYEDASADDSGIEETSNGFTFEGEALYCSHLTQEPVLVTCLDIYADMNINADNRILSVWANAVCADKNRQYSERDADSNEFRYTAHTSLCMRDVIVNGVELIAEDELGNQGIYTMPGDCARIEELFGGN